MPSPDLHQGSGPDGGEDDWAFRKLLIRKGQTEVDEREEEITLMMSYQEHSELQDALEERAATYVKKIAETYYDPLDELTAKADRRL